MPDVCFFLKLMTHLTCFFFVRICYIMTTLLMYVKSDYNMLTFIRGVRIAATESKNTEFSFNSVNQSLSTVHTSRHNERL